MVATKVLATSWIFYSSETNIQSSMKWRKKNRTSNFIENRYKEETTIFKFVVETVTKKIFQRFHTLWKFITFSSAPSFEMNPGLLSYDLFYETVTVQIFSDRILMRGAVYQTTGDEKYHTNIDFSSNWKIFTDVRLYLATFSSDFFLPRKILRNANISTCIYVH